MTWRTLAISVAVALLLGAALGYRLHTPPPAPAVHAVESSATQATTTQRITEAPSRTTITDYAPPACVPERILGPTRTVVGPTVYTPGPERIVRQTVIERGPVVTDTHAATQAEHHAELVLTPPPPVPRPSWAVTAGLQLLPDHRLELGLERRVVGPIWVRAWALQAAAIEPPAVGVGLRVEW